MPFYKAAVRHDHVTDPALGSVFKLGSVTCNSSGKATYAKIQGILYSDVGDKCPRVQSLNHNENVAVCHYQLPNSVNLRRSRASPGIGAGVAPVTVHFLHFQTFNVRFPFPPSVPATLPPRMSAPSSEQGRGGRRFLISASKSPTKKLEELGLTVGEGRQGERETTCRGTKFLWLHS